MLHFAAWQRLMFEHVFNKLSFSFQVSSHCKRLNLLLGYFMYILVLIYFWDKLPIVEGKHLLHLATPGCAHTHGRKESQPLTHVGSRVDNMPFRTTGFHANYSASMGLTMSPKPVTVMRIFCLSLCSPVHRRKIFEE